MAQFVSFSELRTISQNVDSRLVKQAAPPAYGNTVFLSHSSRDSALLPGVVKLLEQYGADVYVDKLDDSLPTTTSSETAAKLRHRIGLARRFVMLVTPNSKDSRWVPWELGLADGKKGEAVALFPSAETVTETQWADQEYLGLYRRIVPRTMSWNAQTVLRVVDHKTGSEVDLKQWLTGQ